MPEGPEAAFIAKTLSSQFKNKELHSVNILGGRYKNHGPPANFNEFKKALPLKLESVSKKGKVLFLTFSGGWTIVSRLGLTGWWYSQGNAPTWRKPTVNVSFAFAGKQHSTLFYSDQLSYGTLTFTKDPSKDLDELAPDIMDSNTTLALFSKRVAEIVTKYPSMPLEELLVDQKRVVSGIGNYLKSEIMYSAKISPTRHIHDVSDIEWKHIFKESKRISAAMTKALGSKKENAYEDQMAVYGKKQDMRGNEVVTYKNKAGRTVYWVPSIQK